MLNKIVEFARDVMLNLGRGHREHVYGKALEVCFGQAMIRYRSEVCCPILYMGEIIGSGRADFIVGDYVIEIKASRQPIEEATDQLRKYLKSLDYVEKKTYKGIILNFNQHTGRVDVLVHGPRENAPVSRSATAAHSRPGHNTVVRSRFFRR